MALITPTGARQRNPFTAVGLPPPFPTAPYPTAPVTTEPFTVPRPLTPAGQPPAPTDPLQSGAGPRNPFQPTGAVQPPTSVLSPTATPRQPLAPTSQTPLDLYLQNMQNARQGILPIFPGHQGPLMAPQPLPGQPTPGAPLPPIGQATTPPGTYASGSLLAPTSQTPLDLYLQNIQNARQGILPIFPGHQGPLMAPQPLPGAPLPPIGQATTPPGTYASGSLRSDIPGLVSSFIASQGLQANQSDPASLKLIVDHLRSQGINAQLDYTDANGHTGGILIDGQPYQLIDGSNRWTPLQPWSTAQPSSPWGTFGGQTGVPTSPANPTGANVFSDPATADWESLLRKVAGQMSQPTQTPDYGGLTQYLKSYMTQLQQPGYSPAEAEQIQNQSLDPLTAQRDAAIQRTIQQYGARGLSPGSGPTLQAIADINRQFEQLRTTTQANFATQAAALTRQNAATAAQVGQTLQTLEQGQQTGNENRALQAVSLLFGIPQLADTRLGLANQTLGGANAGATSALSSMLALRGQQIQQGQWNDAKQQQFLMAIGQLIAGLG